MWTKTKKQKAGCVCPPSTPKERTCKGSHFRVERCNSHQTVRPTRRRCLILNTEQMALSNRMQVCIRIDLDYVESCRDVFRRIVFSSSEWSLTNAFSQTPLIGARNSAKLVPRVSRSALVIQARAAKSVKAGQQIQVIFIASSSYNYIWVWFLATHPLPWPPCVVRLMLTSRLVSLVSLS